MNFSFSTKDAWTILRILLLIATVLCFTSLALEVYDLSNDQDVEVLGRNLGDGIQLLEVDEEQSVPAWFSSSILLLCSALLAVISSARKRVGDTYAFHWRGLSILFVLLSLDEAVSIHERFNEAIRSLLGTGGVLYFASVIPGAAFVAIFLLLYGRFLFNLPVRYRCLFIAAGALYVSGSIGMELLGGYQFDPHGDQNLTFQTMATLEEFLEMSGVILFFYALMRYMSRSQEVDEKELS